MKNIFFICLLFLAQQVLGQQAKNRVILTPKPESSIAIMERFFANNWDDLVIAKRVYARPKVQPVLKFFSVETKPGSAQHFMELAEHSALFSTVESDSWGTLAGCTPSINDPGHSLQWSLDNTGSRNNSKAGADISACEAWDITTGDSSLVVGFVDSGNKNDHADLTGRIWVNSEEIPGNNIDDDANGYIDDVYGWNTWSDNNDVSDVIGHGTQINGIVGANADNGTGFTGINWHCKLMNVKGVNNVGQGLLSWWAEGVYYLVDNGADIINLSLGGPSGLQALEDAINYAHDAGVLVVAATGNDNRSTVSYPAKYTNLIAVGATDHADVRATWSGVQGSNYGPEIDVVAPGKAIYGINPFNNGTSYVTAGTSQAAPHVTGLASLIWTINRQLSVDSVKAIIESTATDQVGNPSEDVAGFDNHHGHGRINAFAALQLAQGQTTSTGQEVKQQITTVSVYPNPSKQQLYLSSEQELPALQARIYNSLGQIVYERSISATSSGQIVELTHRLPPGYYFLELHGKGFQQQEKILVTY